MTQVGEKTEKGCDVISATKTISKQAILVLCLDP